MLPLLLISSRGIFYIGYPNAEVITLLAPSEHSFAIYKITIYKSGNKCRLLSCGRVPWRVPVQLHSMFLYSPVV